MFHVEHKVLNPSCSLKPTPLHFGDIRLFAGLPSRVLKIIQKANVVESFEK
jgi:hypothetical protein